MEKQRKTYTTEFKKKAIDIYLKKGMGIRHSMV